MPLGYLDSGKGPFFGLKISSRKRAEENGEDPSGYDADCIPAGHRGI